MLQSLRASVGSIERLAVTRVAGQQAVLQRRTYLAPTTALRADIVQDLYIKELKAYKTPLVKLSDAEGHVQKFSPPKAPKSPEEGDIASDLKAYEQQQPEVEGQSGGEEATAVEEDWFEDDEEEEAAPAH